MTTTIKVYAKTAVSKNGNKFIVCSSVINDVWYNVKFRRTVTNAPVKIGIYSVTLNPSEASVQTTTYTKDGVEKEGTPILWIHSALEITEASEEEKAARHSAKMNRVFGIEV